jgi:hypothetical protein
MPYSLPPPLDSSQWTKCPNCGLPNIPERQICKRCRSELRQALIPTLPAVYTEVTGTLYTSADAHHLLFVSPSCLEYHGPGATIRTAWSNVVSIRADGAEEYVWLNEPAAVTMFRSADPAMDAWLERTVPLHCFGYPSNPDLMGALRRFAPQIWTHPHSQMRR